MSFIPLHVNSYYSYLSSCLNANDLINASKEYASLTDRNTLIYAVRFTENCRKKNIKPIIGVDLFFQNDLLTFIVKNENGYKNLLKIINNYNEEKSTINDLKNNTEGLAVVLSTQLSTINSRIQELDNEHFALYIKSYFDAIDDFYIGLEIYDDDDKITASKLRNFLLKRDYKLLAFPLIRYIKKEDEISCVIANAIKNDEILDESISLKNGKYYLRSEDEIKQLYEQEEIDNTNSLAQKINFDLTTKQGSLIKYCENSDEILATTSLAKLEEKVSINETYTKRLNYELSVIKKMGYSDYFLIVADYVKFAKENNIFVGPGRGSANGSLVAYALDIITIDPVKSGLVFERFLNPERISMPDIDVDFEDTKRDEISEYIRNRYGNNRVGNIVTVQTIKAKQALRDIGRVYQLNKHKVPYIENLCHAIGDYEDLREAYRKNKVFKDLVKSDVEYLRIVTLASKIQDLPRQESVHPAGVIINNENLNNVLPMYKPKYQPQISQFEKDDLEKLGFLKMDILGLNNLTIVHNIIDYLSEENIKLNYQHIPYEDEEALKLISTGKTIGLFQLESEGMKNTIRNFKLKTFEELVAIIALYRPGPMDLIPTYVRRKLGREKIVYPSNKITNILAPTYGIIVYQEQILEIVRQFANYSYSEADLFRRAISKKDVNKIIALKDEFIKRSISNGNNENEAINIFNTIEKFANYGFNKCHAYAYAKLASQMAYLKAHYTAEFFAALLNNSDNFKTLLNELNFYGIKLSIPNINKSQNKYVVKDKNLIIPFSKIKGIMRRDTEQIISERNKNGEYKDFISFIIRMYPYKISVSTITKLIESGCFDEINKSRASLKANLDSIIRYASLVGNKIESNFLPAPNINFVKDDILENLEKEYELLQLYVSDSPLNSYKEEMIKHGAKLISESLNDTNMKFIGVIKDKRVRISKKYQDKFCFIDLTDNISDVTIALYNKVYSKYENQLVDAKIIIVKGKRKYNANEIIADEIIVL